MELIHSFYKKMRDSKYWFSAFVLTFGFLLLSKPAWAVDHISSRSFWEDTSNLVPFEEAKKQNFKPFDGVLSRGYTSAAVWVKLRITPDKNLKADDNLILRIRPIYLDEIYLYDPIDTSSKKRLEGDRINYRDEEYKSLTFTFVIPAGDVPRDVFLRLKTTSTSLLNVEALSEEDMRESEFHLLMGYCLGLAVVAFFAFFVFINWLNQRDKLYSAFIVRHFIYFVYVAAFFGFHRFFLDGLVDAKYLDLGYNWLVIGATGFSIWYEKQFLNEYDPPKLARWALNGLLAWSAFAALNLALGEIQRALFVNMLLNGVGVLVLLVIACIFIDYSKRNQANRESLLKKNLVVTYYVAVFALMLFSVMPYVGAIAGNEFSINGLPFYAVVSGFMLTVLMQVRASQLRIVYEKASKDLILAEQHAQLEKTRLAEQSQMLAMLMHEIKNPLAVIDLAQQSTTDENAKGFVARNVGIIKNILDRCLSVDQIALGKMNVSIQSVNIDDLLRDVKEQFSKEVDRIAISQNSGLTALNTDRQCLYIILSNLVDNALRYGDTKSQVIVELVSKRNSIGVVGLEISVSNKTGIASWPDQSKVFQKYYRSTGAQSISGTGLGLFLVASITKLLGGNCTYAPDETHVRFELWLPI